MTTPAEIMVGLDFALEGLPPDPADRGLGEAAQDLVESLRTAGLSSSVSVASLRRLHRDLQALEAETAGAPLDSLSSAGRLAQLTRTVLRHTAVGPTDALEDILASASAISSKWWDIRSNASLNDLGDHEFYKGNSRWASGVAKDLQALRRIRFDTVTQVCDAAARLVETRGWDGDYDEPTAARGELLDAIADVRALVSSQ